MTARILIAYATATGSTAEVAVKLGETLKENGFAVDVQPIDNNLSLADYDATLIGSAVQYGTWLPEAVDFVKTHQHRLTQLPTALFCVHIQNQGEDAASRQKRYAYLDAVRPYVRSIDEAYFMGRFNRQGAQLILPSWLSRFIPPMDFRNWSRIRAWAKRLAPQLQPLSPPHLRR